jgi:two-component system, NtrC family, nitrogen regulation sensor histidine kinase GlnL
VDLWHDVIDSLNDGLIVVTPALKICASNPAAEALFGGQITPAILKGLLADNPWLDRALHECIAQRQAVSCADATLNLAGHTLAVRAEISAIMDEDGTLTGAVIMLHDLTPHELAVAGNGERPLGLSPSGLAHEIKNPLTGIKGAAELLAQLFPADQRARQYCEIIIGGVDRIAQLVEQVLSVTGPQRLRQEPVNVHEVLHRALSMAGLFPEAGGIRVEQFFDPSLPEVIGDAAALERVFLNLIRNAIDAIGTRGVLRLRTRVEHTFRVRRGGERRQFLRIEISDSGKGMTEAEQAQLFTPFFTTKADGNGLGLVLSERIIALHGGSLTAQSCQEAPLTGMTFKITLPFAASPRSLTNGEPASSRK